MNLNTNNQIRNLQQPMKDIVEAKRATVHAAPLSRGIEGELETSSVNSYDHFQIYPLIHCFEFACFAAGRKDVLMREYGDESKQASRLLGWINPDL